MNRAFIDVGKQRPTPFTLRNTKLVRADEAYIAEFFALGQSCRITIDTLNEAAAQKIACSVRDSLWTLEAKWHPGVPTSFVALVNQKPNQPHIADHETGELLNYCERLWKLSNGALDITAQPLYQVRNCGAETNHDQSPLSLRKRIGWQNAEWSSPKLKLPEGFTIDFGRLAIARALDYCCSRLRMSFTNSVLVSIGGDFAVSHARKNSAWRIPLRSVDQTVALGAGGVSEWSRPPIDARTGRDAPDVLNGLAVSASSCLEACVVAAMAYVQGAEAEPFLRSEAQDWVAGSHFSPD